MTAVWEVTMGCNMRCGHCGSSCTSGLPDELTTDEALVLIDQIADLGLRWITLSGGEPLMRSDLPLLVQKFTLCGVIVNIITNGWFIDEAIADRLKKSGVSTVAISIDGTEKIHDEIRMKGSFERIVKAVKILKNARINVGAVTTVSTKNIDILPQMRRMLIDMGVNLWQIQLAQPMGNLKERPEWVCAPKEIDTIIDFCYDTWLEGKINIRPADCIGYYSQKERIIRQKPEASGSIWGGCNAGLRNFGILQNGDILGCTSIRDKSFIEGNIREKSLSEIWSDPNSFSWRRKAVKDQLCGDCAICSYGSRCLGGCPNVRLTMYNDINADNLYCSYNLALKRLREHLAGETDCQWLVMQAEQALKNGDFQTSAFFSERALELEPESQKALAIKGYAEFMCGNYSLCKEANEKALSLSPNDTYAMKGLGLALHKMGDSALGLEYIEEAAKITNYADADIMRDLSYVKQEMERNTVN